jgi:hypothetical protein
MKLWDSTRAETGRAGTTKRKNSKSHFTPKTQNNLENEWGIAKFFTLWDGCESKMFRASASSIVA